MFFLAKRLCQCFFCQVPVQGVVSLFLPSGCFFLLQGVVFFLSCKGLRFFFGFFCKALCFMLQGSCLFCMGLCAFFARGCVFLQGVVFFSKSCVFSNSCVFFQPFFCNGLCFLFFAQPIVWFKSVMFFSTKSCVFFSQDIFFAEGCVFFVAHENSACVFFFCVQG